MVYDSLATTALRSITRTRRDLVTNRVAVVNHLCAYLRVVFPAAPILFAALDAQIRLTFLERFTPQGQGNWLSPKRLGGWLKSVSCSGKVEAMVLQTRLLGAPHTVGILARA